ncbi:hypothetical protein [Marinovum sp.]|uniref:hypothetical protein n=1 Tax=Marinovum sp. TaxID=2024839 RepID=UPI002B279C63|nr:hypothetical protein [Marinovum sp.]
MDKSAIKTRLLELTRDDYDAAREKYETLVAEARVPGNEPLEHDQQSRAESNGELAAAWDEAMHDDEARLRRINEIDFGAKDEITPGAAVELDGRVLVVCVATPEFEVDGQTVMGISPAAPIFRAMEGLGAGDSFDFNGARHEIIAVH